MADLRVRAYNVGFGEAILASIPDRVPSARETIRHVLIGGGGEDESFRFAATDIVRELAGRPLDLFVMSHEHPDHVQGLLWAIGEAGLDIRATHAWFPASASGDSRRKKLDLGYDRAVRHFATAGVQPAESAALMRNNDPELAAHCVRELRGIANESAFLHRESELEGAHPFEEARFTILAPEKDGSIYYGNPNPFALAPGADSGGGAAAAADPAPPPGVDPETFRILLEHRRKALMSNLFGIDRAAHDSSIVFLIEWRGWKLLFPGDAGRGSWTKMESLGVLPESVHFLKVADHGSWTGTPHAAALDRILPLEPHADGRPRSAIVSTRPGVRAGIPDTLTLDELRRRCTLHETGSPGAPPFVDIMFPG